MHTIFLKSHKYHHKVAQQFKEDGQLYGVINDCICKVPQEVIVERIRQSLLSLPTSASKTEKDGVKGAHLKDFLLSE